VSDNSWEIWSDNENEDQSAIKRELTEDEARQYLRDAKNDDYYAQNWLTNQFIEKPDGPVIS
jgi:hypothetical protein